MSREENIINNLFSFNCNFSRFTGTELINQSPDYILEKFNKWIGTKFESVKMTSDQVGAELKSTFGGTERYNQYKEKWGTTDELNPILVYLITTSDLNLDNITNQFGKIFGSLNLINDDTTAGLHVKILEHFMPAVVEKNLENIKGVVRDMKIGNII